MYYMVDVPTTVDTALCTLSMDDAFFLLSASYSRLSGSNIPLRARMTCTVLHSMCPCPVSSLSQGLVVAEMRFLCSCERLH